MIIFVKNIAKNKKRKQCVENKSCFTCLSQADTAAFNKDRWAEVGRDTRVAAARTSIQKGNYPLPLEVIHPLAWSIWPWQPALALGNFVSNTSAAACSWLKKRECHEAWGLPKWHCETQEKTWKNFNSYATSLTLPHSGAHTSGWQQASDELSRISRRARKIKFWFL